MNQGLTMHEASPHTMFHDYEMGANALLIAARAEDAAVATEALALAGVRVATRVAIDDAEAMLRRATVDLVMIEAAGAAPAHVELLLAGLASEPGLIVVIDEDQIDAAAVLLGSDAQLLCRPSLAERVAAVVLVAGRTRGRVHDTSRNTETERLQRLNEEVARIADTLARLTRGEEPLRRPAGVRDPGTGYRGPDEPMVEPGGGSDATAGEVRAAIRSRRMRNQYFAGELFADPAWDMLLDLYAAELDGQRVSVSSLCIAAAVPPTTALRWIGTMHDAGLFERHADPSDRRRAYIALSEKALAGMRGYIAAVKRAGLAIA